MMKNDSVDKRPRVLVVEDSDTMRKMLVRSLLLRGEYRVDEAADLEQAMEALDSCAYQVALVDIMLAGAMDTANRDGAKVLERIRDLEEGTRAIVLSGQDEPQLARDFLKEYAAADYIAKNELRKKGIGKLVEMVAAEAEASPVGEKPSWDTVIAALAGDRGEPMFVSEVMKLDFKGGFENLRNNLGAAIRHLLPLLPEREADTGLVVNGDHGFKGRFWSRGQACAVELALLGNGGPPADPDANGVMLEREKGGLRVVVSRLPELSRDAFALSA